MLRLIKCKEVDKDYFLNHPVLLKHISLLEKVKNSYLPEDNIVFLKTPGRVNLIGEHTDYNMGPVLPCAIDREIVFCIRENHSNEINATNVNPNFEDIRFSVDQPIESYSSGHWGNYIKAGIKGLIDHLKLQNPAFTENYTGYDIIVSSTLPLAAGLSSSSALVVAAAYSFVIMNQIDLNKTKLAEICAKAEHFVGTAGGGMDQATSLLGQKDAFLKIEFNPLQIETIQAPTGIRLVLFHSLVEAEKSGRVRDEYNRRVLECRIGVDLFNNFMKIRFEDEFYPVDYIGEIRSERLNLEIHKLEQHIKNFINQLKDSYSIHDFSTLLNLSESELSARYQSILREKQLKEPSGGFKIKGRFRHVFTECQRVERMAGCLSKGYLREVGELLNDSHKSLSKDYDVSTAEVDELISILLDNGVAGARLMGAGFGGMVLAYLETDDLPALIKKVKATYYSRFSDVEPRQCIFPCVVADGAGKI